jgi:hypothetical protein
VNVAFMPVVSVFILTLALGASDPCPPEGPSSYESTDYRMRHFHPDPDEGLLRSDRGLENFSRLQRGMQCVPDKWLSEESPASLLAAVFLARAHGRYGYPLLDMGTLDDRALDIWRKGRSSISRYVNDDSQVDERKLDVWWVSYFATGETTYLDRIMRWVGDPGSQADAARASLVGAANLTVAHNRMDLFPVYQYVDSILKRDPPVPNAQWIRRLVSRKSCLRVFQELKSEELDVLEDRSGDGGAVGPFEALAGTWVPASHVRHGALQKFSTWPEAILAICISSNDRQRSMRIVDYSPGHGWGLLSSGPVYSFDGTTYSMQQALNSSVGCGSLVSLQQSSDGLVVKFLFAPPGLPSYDDPPDASPDIVSLRRFPPQEFVRQLYVRGRARDIPEDPCSDRRDGR